MKIPRTSRNLFLQLAVVMIALIPGSVLANETTSAIRGKIIGDDGNTLSNASVVVVNQSTGVTRRYSTNDDGNFYAARLPVGGPYKITVNEIRSVTVDQIVLGDAYIITINMRSDTMEEVKVYGTPTALSDVATGPSASFTEEDLAQSIGFDRDVMNVYTIDPRINLDQNQRGSEINCGGKHPRFNSVTLDGVSHNDRFGLNNNGYSTATGMPFPYDAIQQVSVEMAPFDVTYGGFSACNINAVTKSGTNTWTGGIFLDFTSENFRGTTIDGEPEQTPPDYDRETWGVQVGGPLIKDKLFVFAAYEKANSPQFIGQGYAGSGIGTERSWLSESDFSRITQIAQTVYDYDPGGAPSDGTQENEKYMVRFDWNINDSHGLSAIYNYFDGFQDRASDGDSNEFEFSNHFYVKGSVSETYSLKLVSQWTDAFSTEVFVNANTMDDSQTTRGPGDFGDFQIAIDDRTGTVYLGADDSRQANSLNTESDYFRLVGEYLVGDHVITAGYEREELTVFNIFVQHSRGGEYDFFDSSGDNPEFCTALGAQGRFDDAACGLSGIDRFELGRPSRIYYGSAGGTNVATDAAAVFTNTVHSFFIKDDWYLPNQDLTLSFGIRYDSFETNDGPVYNEAVTDLLGVRNDADIDGLDIIMPRFGFSWEPREELSIRGGVGLYSGGNPTVWLSNTFSNDGITNVQEQLGNFGATNSVLDGSIPITAGGPGRGVPQELFDNVANTTAANASTRRVVLLDPGYDQPSEWKFALGATYEIPWNGLQLDFDYLHTEMRDAAVYVDLSQEIVGSTILGQPIYDFVNGSDNLMLTNTGDNGKSDMYSIVARMDFDSGLKLMLGYAYTEGEDVSPMTSATAGSNFDNTATLDINNPGVGRSNYVVPHRFTFQASYTRDFFQGLTTRFTLQGFANEGQPATYVMQGTDLEGDGFFGRHRLYVPTGPDDPNVVFTMSAADQVAFFNFVDKEDLGVGFVDRNETNARWSSRFDFRIDQELPTFMDAVKGRAFMKIYNLSNLLNDDWGQSYDAEFFSPQVVNASIDDEGRYVYSGFSNRSVTRLQEQRTFWEILFGIEFSF